MRTKACSVAAILAILPCAALLPCADAMAQAQPAGHDDVRMGVREAKPREAGTLRVATYNTENLFDQTDDPEVVDDPNTSSNEDDAAIWKPTEELEALAKTIRAVDADVLALEEIESEQTLLWFRDTYLAGMGYDHVASLDAGDRRGIECSVLSRYPLKDPQVWPNAPLGGVHPEKWGTGRNYLAGEPILLRRSPLKVTVVVDTDNAESPEKPASSRFGSPAPEHDDAEATGGAYELTLFVVHHKSGGPAGYWREREARWVLERIREVESADPEANVLVLGDFNATPGESSQGVYAGAGLTDVFDGVDRTSPVWQTHESGRVLDYIMANAGASHEIKAGSGFILGTPMRPEDADWRTVGPPPGYASDHLPVVIELWTGDREG